MSSEPIRLRPIERVSPTLAELLRQCKLRAGLACVEEARDYVLGNPKAWLGRAYHAVLEAAGRARPGEIETIATKTWDSAIQAEYERARSHPLDSRFGPPESWPGYHLVRAMAFARARELAAPGSGRSDTSARLSEPAWRERQFSGAGGRIIGRPDLVRSGEVVDFKTADVFAEEDTEEVKPAYTRQLRLYAFLVNETLGWWPQRGVLLPMSGTPLSIELEPEECEAEAGHAIHLMDEYNQLVAQGTSIIDLASPSPTTCRWCPFQLLCPAFWSAIGPEWREGIPSPAVAGTAIEHPIPVHGGKAFRVALRVEQGTELHGESISLHPLQHSIYTDLPQIHPGNRLRVTGLGRRPNGEAAPILRTQIALERTVPRIQLLE